MKALSLKQPWAWLIFHGKNVENRTWRTNFRGSILIHASKTWDSAGAGWIYINLCRGRLPIKECPTRDDPQMRRGALIGVVDIVDCVGEFDSPWFVGPYGFILENPLEFKKPISCKGQLGIFEVPGAVVNGEFWVGRMV
jgi:hypothetical protein